MATQFFAFPFFFPSDVVPSSDHSGFQTLGILSFMIEVTFYCKTKRFTRVCILELTSRQEWVVVDSSFVLMRGTLANSPQLSMISISLFAKVYQWISSFVRDMSLLDQCHSSLFSRKTGDLGRCEVIHLKNRGTQHTIVPSP